MSLFTRISIVLLCGVLAAGNSGAAASLWSGCDSESESSDMGGGPESENEADSLELALPGRQDPLAQLAAPAASQPGSEISERETSFAQISFMPPSCLSVGTGTGGPQRC